MALYSYTSMFIRPTEGLRMREVRTILSEINKYLTMPQKKKILVE